MKKRLQKILVCLVCLGLAAAAALCPAAFAAADLDRIEQYFVTVQLQPDGSAVIAYDIHWLVLDSTSAGPLEWVKIGVPNENIDQLTAQSDTIRRISAYHEGGSYVRLDLDKRYYAGETVRLQFSLHATHLYELGQDGGVNYQFTPGWFDEAETGRLTLAWQDGGQGAYQVENPSASLEAVPQGVIVRCEGMGRGETLTLTADYADQSGFAAAPLDPQMTREYAAGGSGGQNQSERIQEFVILLLFTLVLVWILTRSFSGRIWLGGFGGWFGPHHHGGPRPPRGGAGGFGGGAGGFGGGSSRGAGAGRRSSSGCACACACVSCACACACAGGGRAGCSAKEFKGALDVDALQKALSQKEEADDGQ